MQGTSKRIATLVESCATKPHGQRARYVAGCHCLLCRAAHARYNAASDRRTRRGITNRVIPADRAREHLRKLSAMGIGRRAVRAATDLSETILYEVSRGMRLQIRQETERRILAVNESARSDHSLVDAAPTWRLLNELGERGYSKAQLAHWLGKKTPALQLSKRKILASHAVQVQRLYAKVEAGLLRRDTPVRLRRGS